MNKIYIDDKYLESFANCKTLNELAESISEHEKARIKDGVVIFIYINFKFNGSKRQHQSGMELLIWFRLKNVMNHCVMYSFETLHSLLNRQPRNLIATSKGTSFMQLPFVKENVDVSELIQKLAELESIKQTLKSAFSIDVFRHKEANWWGVLVQWKIHQIFNPTFKVPYPANINKKNSDLNSSVAKFIYLDKHSIKRVDLANLKKVQSFVKTKKPKILQIDDQSDEGWAEINQHIIYEAVSPLFYKNVEVETHDTIDSVFTKAMEIISPTDKTKQPFKPDLILLDVRLFPAQDVVVKNVEELSGSQILKKIREQYIGLPIIITTASNKIWTYQKLLKLGADAYWLKEGLDESKSTDDSLDNYEYFLQVIAHILSDDYALLKLMAEKVKSIQVRKFYWWERKNWRVDKITIAGKQISLKEITVIKKEELTNIYLDGIGLYREFLTNKLFSHGFKLSNENDWFYYSSIILHLGKIIELIHNLNTAEYKKYGSFSKPISTRRDWKGIRIYDDRNSAAHLEKSKKIGFLFLKNFVEDLNKYLQI